MQTPHWMIVIRYWKWFQLDSFMLILRYREDLDYPSFKLKSHLINILLFTWWNCYVWSNQVILFLEILEHIEKYATIFLEFSELIVFSLQ